MQQLPERRYRDMLDDHTGVLTEDQRGGNTTLRVGSAYVQVYADKRAVVPAVRLTFSAPAILDGHNREPLPLWLLPDVADAVWTGVSRELTGMPAYEDLESRGSTSLVTSSTSTPSPARSGPCTSSPCSALASTDWSAGRTARGRRSPVGRRNAGVPSPTARARS